MNKLKIITSIIITSFLATWIIYAWVDLWTVNPWEGLTSTLWNNLVSKINENWQKLSWVYNSAWNIWLWEVNPTYPLEITRTAETPTQIRIKNTATTWLLNDPWIRMESRNSNYQIFANDENNSLVFWDTNLWLADMTITGSWNVWIWLPSPTAKLDVNWTINWKYEWFSYYWVWISVVTWWQAINISTMDYNTFWSSTYNSWVFTAPKNGFYNFNLHWYSATSDASDNRYAYWISKNWTLISFAWWNYSVSDTPATTFSHNIYLNAWDTIWVQIFSAINATYGGAAAWHQFWFQWEYLWK